MSGAVRPDRLPARRDGAGWWQFFAFGAAPDLAPGIAPGQLHPRAVPLYNALHRFWGPAALLVAATVGPLRSPDGFQAT